MVITKNVSTLARLKIQEDLQRKQRERQESLRQQQITRQTVVQAQPTDLQSRIKSIENQLRLARIEKAREIKSKDKSGRSQEIARIKVFKSGLARLNKGEFLSVQSIINLADSKGFAARRGKLRRQKKKQDVKISIPKTLEGREVITQVGPVVRKKKPVTKVKKERIKPKTKFTPTKPKTKFIPTKPKTTFTRAKLSQKDLDRLKVVLPISTIQQLSQQQTTTKAINDFLKVQQKQKSLLPLRFDIRGDENLKRGFKGERVELTAFGILVRKPNGKLRTLTNAEIIEFLPQPGFNLNPFNVVTGFIGVGKDLGFATTTSNKKAKIAAGVVALLSEGDKPILNTVDSAISNPFGFIGEVIAGGAITKSIIGVFRGFKNFKIKDKSQLTFDINKFKGKGVKNTDRTPDGNKLRNLEQQKKIVDADLKDLDNAINRFDKPTKSKSKLNNDIKVVKKLGSDIRKRNKTRIKLKQELKDFKLKPVKAKPIRVIQKLPKDAKQINNLLLEARGISGNAFKQLKLRIKRTFNLNVVQRGTGSNIKFVLLKPKVQKRKGVLTKKVQVPFFDIINGKIVKVKPTKIELPLKEKLTNKDLKDLEFKAGQDLDLLQKDFRRIAQKQEFFSNKKAQGKMVLTFRKHFNKRKLEVKNVKSREKQLGLNIRKFNNRLKQPIRTRATLNQLRKIKSNLSKTKSKIKQDLKQTQKDLSKLRTISTLILGQGLKTGITQKQQQAQDLDIAQALKQINAFDETKPTPTKPSPTKPKLPVKPPTRLGKKPPTRPKVKPPVKVVRPKPRPGKKPPKKPPKPPLRIKFKFNTKLPQGFRLGYRFVFRERANISKNFNKRTNKIKVKSNKKKQPVNKTLRDAIKRIRQSTAQSMDLKIVGITKEKDIKPFKLTGFRLKKIGTDTLRLVQLNPIETVAEKRQFARARKQARAQKKKITKSKPKKRKSSKK